MKLVSSDNMDIPYGLTVRGIIKNSSNEILIVKRHPKSKTDPEMWELPGGKWKKANFSLLHWSVKLKRKPTWTVKWETSAKPFKTITYTKEPSAYDVFN